MIDREKSSWAALLFVATGADACDTSRQFDIVSEYIASNQAAVEAARLCSKAPRRLSVFRGRCLTVWRLVVKVLKLSAQGLPQSWITLEQAALHYAADEVRWEAGARSPAFAVATTR
jgi:hypothetical protein